MIICNSLLHIPAYKLFKDVYFNSNYLIIRKCFIASYVYAYNLFVCIMPEALVISTSLPALLPFGRSCLLLCALLPIFVLFSDLSKILTSADQHSAQITNFLEKEDSLPPTASSLHSGDRKIQLSTFKQMRENASSGIYLLHELPQTSTKDCGS